MSDPVSIIREIIRDELKLLRMGDIGVVTSVFPHADGDNNNYECNVRLRDSDIELQKVPMTTPHIGMVSTPRIDDLVLLSYMGGDPNAPVITGRLYSDKANPPVHEKDEWRVEVPYKSKTSIAIDKNESVIFTAGETVITLKKDDTITIASKSELKMEIKGNAEINCTDCKLNASGNISLGEGGKGVITEESHKCYFTGKALKGSSKVTAKV